MVRAPLSGLRRGTLWNPVPTSREGHTDSPLGRSPGPCPHQGEQGDLGTVTPGLLVTPGLQEHPHKGARGSSPWPSAFPSVCAEVLVGPRNGQRAAQKVHLAGAAAEIWGCPQPQRLQSHHIGHLWHLSLSRKLTTLPSSRQKSVQLTPSKPIHNISPPQKKVLKSALRTVIESHLSPIWAAAGGQEMLPRPRAGLGLQ